MLLGVASNWRVTFFTTARPSRQISFMRYAKPPLTLDQQVELLQSRGLHVADVENAKAYLSHINYYRLRGYWLPFEQAHDPHVFRPGVSFDDVLKLYVFDRELRLLIMDAIERVEVSMRANWAYHLAHEHGSHAHMNSALFNSPFWRAAIHRLTGEVIASREVFIKHYCRTYSVPQLPSIWSVSEIMSLGTLSRWYKSLKPPRTRRLISGTYNIDEEVLGSVLHHLSYLRNLCAHHNRVWNRQMTVITKLPRSKPYAVVGALNFQAERQLYNSLVILGWMAQIASPETTWKIRVLDLIEEYDADTVAMGFPHNFKKCAFWK